MILWPFNRPLLSNKNLNHWRREKSHPKIQKTQETPKSATTNFPPDLRLSHYRTRARTNRRKPLADTLAALRVFSVGHASANCIIPRGAAKTGVLSRAYLVFLRRGTSQAALFTVRWFYPVLLTLSVLMPRPDSCSIEKSFTSTPHYIYMYRVIVGLLD